MRTRTAKRRRNIAKPSTLRVTLAIDEADAIALKRRLESAANKGRHIEIDAGAIAALTTAGVQVLLAAAADAEVRHVRFRLTACGSSIIDAFGELGLSDKIATWLDPAGAAARVA